jgi:mono/diheme cytochrome c family protein
VALAFVAIQAVPYGHHHENPATRAEPGWDSSATRALAARACFDCHSNETVWPWYANIAPMSWLTQRDVDKGRRKLNFSEWDRRQKEGRESAKSVSRGKMPPWFYLALHPAARLTSSEAQALVAGLEATLGTRGARREGRSRDDRDD